MISLYDILEASNGQLFGEPTAQIFTDFCIEVDRAAPNTLFVTLKTDQGDSHIYIPEAIKKGASGILCTRPPDCDTEGVSVVMVRDTVDALLAWAHMILGKTGVKVIGVAGSIGRSVAVSAIARVLAIRFPVISDIVETDGRLGIPLALAKLTSQHKFVILKISATQPGEMASIVQAIQPEVGVITDIGDFNGSGSHEMEQFVEEQKILIEYLSPGGLAVLNYDSDMVRAMGSRARAPVVTVGINEFGADMMAHSIVVGPDGTGFDLRYQGERYVGHWIPLLGKHHLYSVMAALVVGKYYGVSMDEALRALTTLQPLPGHMNSLIGKNDALLIDDTYNANPQSTLAALDWLSAIKSNRMRTIFVVGDMEGPSANNRTGYRLIGQKAADVADVIITQGMDAALVARAALDKGMEPKQVRTTYSTHDTVALLENEFQLNRDDLVLLKGGASARLELVTRALLKDASDMQKLARQEYVRDAMAPFQPTRPSWVDIDTEALASNIRAIKKLVGESVALMAVVKADAYGHGAVTVARTALLNGATYLGVASIAEALDLREAGIEAPVLAMSYTPTYLIRQAIQHNITVTVYDLDVARAYDRAGREVGGRLRVHLKVDSGMGRLGAMPDQVVALFRHMTTMQNIEIEGIYTHFSSADEDEDYTLSQLNVFKGLIRPLQATSGFKFKYTHAANSAATLAYKDAHFNMVRVGLALYGLQPSQKVPLPQGFRPVLSWKTSVIQVKTLPPGHAVGYGNTYVTQDEEQIAIIPVGYADGLRRAPQHWGEVLVRGQPAPIVGRVSMDKTAVNVSAIPGVSIGDEVVLLGTQGQQTITAEEIAKRLGTINYDVVCSVLPRVPRRR